MPESPFLSVFFGGDRIRIPSRAVIKKKDILMDILFTLLESNPGLEVRMSPLRSGPRKTEVHRTSCFSASLRSAQIRGPLDLVRRLAFRIIKVHLQRWTFFCSTSDQICSLKSRVLGRMLCILSVAFLRSKDLSQHNPFYLGKSILKASI